MHPYTVLVFQSTFVMPTCANPSLNALALMAGVVSASMSHGSAGSIEAVGGSICSPRAASLLAVLAVALASVLVSALGSSCAGGFVGSRLGAGGF